MTKIGTVIEGKYEVLREIGRGGMSVVYLAMDTRLNKQWAIKEIRKRGKSEHDEIVVNSLLAEANMMKRLDHPALPRIVDIIDNGVTIYVVMDYIEGESLDKILNEYGAQPEDKVISWAMQIADALSYLHSQRPPIIYRDMKPANVMLKPEGNIKIIDFGIAREYKEQKLSDTTVLGTKGYAPPEQYSGQTDPRSDIYALGMTMHHLLTGVDPRNGDVYIPVRALNPEVSEGIEIIIDKCVQPAAENRYQTCADLIYDLQNPDVITKGFKRRQKRRLAAFISVAALCVAMLISGVVCNGLSTFFNNKDYDQLLAQSTSTADLQTRIDNLKEAIKLKPDDPTAYLQMLDAFEDEGFGTEEDEVFQAVYLKNKNAFDTASTDVAELNCKAGLMYFNYYTKTGDLLSASVRNRIKKAKPFFEANYDNPDISTEFTKKNVNDLYYRICEFWDDYILESASPKEASKEDYEELIRTIKEMLIEARNAEKFEQLTLYNGVFMLLYDRREALADAGVDQDEFLELFDTVFQNATSMEVSKDQSKRLQEEMEDHYDNFRDSIVNAYGNSEQD